MQINSGLATLVLAAVIAIAGLGPSRAATVEGKVSYRERIVPPADAVIELALLDISRADAPAETLALQRYALDRVPFAFSLHYDDALIVENHRYSIQARILSGGRSIFRTTSVHPVLTGGAGDTADVTVERMAEAETAETAERDMREWIVSELQGRLLVIDEPPVLYLAPDGRFAAKGGCNRFTGKAEIEGDEIRFPEAFAGTRMACAPPRDRLENDFLEALGYARRMVESDAGLALVNEAGVTVMRLMPSR